MTLESPSYGSSNWPLPSPSATPKSRGQIQNQFESPAGQSPSSFADAYYTPTVKGQQTPALTPDSGSTSVDRHRSINSAALTPHDPHFHNNFSATSSLPLPPVDPSRRLSSSPNPQIGASRFVEGGLQVRSQSPAKMNSYNLHTPPPGEAQRHIPLQHPHTVHGQSYAHAHDPMHTPLRQHTMNFAGQNLQVPTYQTPFNQNLTVSTDIYGFPDGPASAPPMSQARPMWDHSPLMSNFDQRAMGVAQPQFDGSNTPMHNWQTPTLHSHTAQGGFPQQAMTMPSTPDHNDFWLSGGLSSQPSMNNFVPDSSFVQHDSSVNPSVLFSFTSPPQTIDPTSTGPLFSQTGSDVAARQPYEHQVRASTQERESLKKTRQLHLLPSQSRTGSTLAPSNRPLLQRSNTDSGFRRSRIKAGETKSAAQLGESILRRDSPLKRHSQNLLTAIPESTSRSSKLRTRLVIDASGTARTETISGADSGVWSRRKSSSLLDDDSSEEDAIVSSQRNSFVLGSDLLRPSKHGRNDSDDEDGGLYKRPLSTASLSSLTARMGATPLSNRASIDTRSRVSQDYAAFLNKLASSSQDTIQGHGDESDAGDAQSALKKLVGGRSRRDPNDPNATIKPRRAATNPVRSSAMFDITKFPSPPSPPTMFERPSNTNTPNTERSIQSVDSTRCVCGTVEENGNSPVVRCESCANLLHVRCVFGKRAEERGVKLPRTYVCAFCTGQARPPSNTLTPGHFQGHDSGFGASPLGHKSGLFFG